MLKIYNKERARRLREFEAVKGLAKNNFNDYFILISTMALFSLLVLITSVVGDDIAFATATLVVISGSFFILYILAECKLIYPLRFKILYTRKK